MPPVAKPKRERSRHFIREWREYRGLTQDQLASRLNISRVNLGRIERGLVPYNQDFLELAGEALNCEPADLIVRNPLDKNALWSIHEALKKVSEKERGRIVQVVETLAKTGT